MVARILDAARHVLIERGYDGASTVRIAERAGISPGSLYQYYPNKQAIVAAVIDEFITEIAAMILQHVIGVLGEPAAVIVRTSITAAVDALGTHEAMLRTVIEQTPSLAEAQTLGNLGQRMAEIVTAYLASNPTYLRVGVDPATAAWFLVNTVGALLVRYTLGGPPISREVFIEELTHLALSYASPEAAVSNAN